MKTKQSMSLTDSIRDYLNEPRFAILATTGKSGRIQQTVMWYRMDGDTVVMNTAKGRTKAINLESHPDISVCVADGYRFLTLQGTATIDADPERGQREIQTIGLRYVDQAEIERTYRDTWKHQERITIEMPIDHVIANGF